jgi:hypothetical protein
MDPTRNGKQIPVSLHKSARNAPECGAGRRRRNCYQVYAALWELASSIRLIICGEGHIAEREVGKPRTRRFRMKTWTSIGMSSAWPERRSFYKDKYNEVAVAAIRRQPALGALSTNARLATHLMTSVHEISKSMPKPIDWDQLIEDHAVNLLQSVVARYSYKAGLHYSLELDRFCVAASVFRACTAGRMEADITRFLDLPVSLRHLAMSLVDLNLVELVHDGTRYIERDKPAVLVTPAVEIVLCTLLGVHRPRHWRVWRLHG